MDHLRHCGGRARGHLVHRAGGAVCLAAAPTANADLILHRLHSVRHHQRPHRPGLCRLHQQSHPAPPRLILWGHVWAGRADWVWVFVGGALLLRPLRLSGQFPNPLLGGFCRLLHLALHHRRLPRNAPARNQRAPAAAGLFGLDPGTGAPISPVPALPGGARPGGAGPDGQRLLRPIRHPKV